MSQAMQQLPPWEPDAYVLAQQPPNQEIKLDPQYGSIRMWTPVGRLAYVTLDKPRAIKQPNGQPGAPKFQCTILLNPNACGPLYEAIVAVAQNRVPYEDRPDPATNQMRRYSAAELLQFRENGLQYPLRMGTQTWQKDPVKYGAWKELFVINASTNAVNNKTGASNQPVCLDESGAQCQVDRFYSGCYGRLQITIFFFPAPGQQMPNRGVGIALQAVQFARPGPRLSGFDAVGAAISSAAAIGALPVENFPDPNFGPNSAGPGNIPPGHVLGFAAPPGQAPQPQYQQPPPQQPPPPPPQGYPPAQPASGYPPPQQQPAYAPPPQQPAPQYAPPPQQYAPPPPAGQPAYAPPPQQYAPPPQPQPQYAPPAGHIPPGAPQQPPPAGVPPAGYQPG